MAQISKSVILDKVEEMALPYFIVWDADGKTRLYQNLEDDEANPSRSRALLSEFMDSTSGTVIVQLQAKKAMNQGDTRQIVKMTTYLNGSTAVGSINGTHANGSTGTDIERILQLQKENFELQLKAIEAQHKRDIEMMELKREIQEVKNQDFFEKHGDKIAGLLPYLLNRGAAATASPIVNGTEVEADQNPVLSIIERLAHVDENYLQNLEMLATLAEQKPEMYAQGVAMIKNLI